MMNRKDRRRSLTPVHIERRGAERRVHERVLVDIEVDCRADDTFLFAYITDISAMGIFVKTDTPHPQGSRLNLCFRTTGGEKLEVEGEVIWINPVRPNDAEGRNPGMGIEFVDLTPRQREEILRMVRTFAYLNDDPDERGGHA
jgi:type IV pilus assembly protein PilZ